MARGGREHAVQNHDIETQADRYAELLARLTRTRRITVSVTDNAAFLVRAKGETFYKKSLADDKRCGTWVGALEIQLAEDAYERTRSGAHAQLVRDLTTTFLNKEGTHWSGDKWNDDIQWMMIACIRGYRITGNAALLNTTVSAWNMVYDRGWDATYDGGIWENMDNVPAGGKCSLSNWPMIIAGTDIYQSTRDAAILAKCRAIYAWGRAHLFDSKTGRVYEQFRAKGTDRRRQRVQQRLLPGRGRCPLQDHRGNGLLRRRAPGGESRREPSAHPAPQRPPRKCVGRPIRARSNQFLPRQPPPGSLPTLVRRQCRRRLESTALG